MTKLYDLNSKIYNIPNFIQSIFKTQMTNL